MTAKATAEQATTNKTVSVYRLWDIVRIVNGTYSSLLEMHENPNVATPTPVFEHSGTSYWSEDSLPVWKELVDKEIERLASISYTKSELTELLLRLAQDTQIATGHTYTRGRGNYSKGYARQRVAELEGVIKFVSRLGDGGPFPKELGIKIREHLREAKENAGVS